MELVNSKELIIHRAISRNIIDNLESVLVKLEKICLKDAEEYKSLDSQIRASSSVEYVFENARRLEKIKESLVFNLTLKFRLSKIIEKNRVRIKYLDMQIKEQKLSDIEFSPKQIAKKFENEKVEDIEQKNSLGLEDNSNSKVFFNGNLLSLKNGEIDLSNTDNIKIIESLDEKDLLIILSKFPKCLKTISGEGLINNKLKIKILTCIIILADQLLKSKSIYDVNEYFGNLILVSRDTRIDIKKYIDEVQNLFNAQIRQYLVKRYPNLVEFINDKLQCNLNSEYLPALYRDIVAEESNIDDIIQEDLLNLLDDIDF